MITKKEQNLALVAEAVLACGILSGSSAEEIISFAKKNAPTKDLDFIAALIKAAKGKA